MLSAMRGLQTNLTACRRLQPFVRIVIRTACKPETCVDRRHQIARFRAIRLCLVAGSLINRASNDAIRAISIRDGHTMMFLTAFAAEEQWVKACLRVIWMELLSLETDQIGRAHV